MVFLFQATNKYRSNTASEKMESQLLLESSKQIYCYHGKPFARYLTFLMDRIHADCCEEPAFTASINPSFKKPVLPMAPIMPRSWLEEIDGPKVYLKADKNSAGVWRMDWYHCSRSFVYQTESMSSICAWLVNGSTEQTSSGSSFDRESWTWIKTFKALNRLWKQNGVFAPLLNSCNIHVKVSWLPIT